MRVIVLLTCLCGLTSAVAQDEKVTLEWKFKKGDTLRYEVTVAQEMGGQGSFEMLFGYAMEVTDVAEETATLKVVYDRVKVKIAGQGKELNYDSDAPKANEKDPLEKGEEEEPGPGMVRKLFAAMVGKSIAMKMNAKGKVLEIKGLDTMMKEIAKELGEQGEAMVQMMAQMFDPDQMKNMMQVSFGFLPGKPVGKGESWEQTSEFAMPMVGKADLKHKLTLKEIRGGGKEAVIAMDTKYEMKGTDDEAMVRITSGKMEGELVWSIEAGRLDAMKGMQTMKMSMGENEMETTTSTAMRFAPLPPKKGK